MFPQTRDQMKTLVVFVLAVLGCSLTEGRILTRCELRDQLNSVKANLTVTAKQNGLSVDNLVLKLVCQVEQTTGFNTSAVTQHSGPQTEDHDSSEEVNHDSREKKNSKRHRRHERRPPAQNCSLYGAFQFSSCHVCNDSVTPSANICGTACSNFLDDDIRDDLSCLVKIPFSPHGCAKAEKACEDVKTSVYFSQCPSA